MNELVANINSKIDDAEKLFEQLGNQIQDITKARQQLVGRVAAYREMLETLMKEVEAEEPNAD